MPKSPKHQRIECQPSLTFFQWISVFFGLGLECDSPILESLHHSMFLFLDLAFAMDPEKLYTGMRERKWPATEKAAWWEHLQRLATPKIKSLFPVDSPFADFEEWFPCRCFRTDWSLDTRRRFPQHEGCHVDPDFWSLCCKACTSREQDIYDPELHMLREHSDYDHRQFEYRRVLREDLKRKNGFQCGDIPGTEDTVTTWGLVSNCEIGGEDSSIMIIPQPSGFGYCRSTHKNVRFSVDFFAICFILNRAQISYQRWKGSPIE